MSIVLAAQAALARVGVLTFFSLTSRISFDTNSPTYLSRNTLTMNY